MTVTVTTTAEYLEAEAQAEREGRRITGLKRGRTNASWLLTLSEPAEPELGEAYPHPVLRRLPFDFQEGGYRATAVPQKAKITEP